MPTASRSVLVAATTFLSVFVFPSSAVAGSECMESLGCPDKVQRCFDGICTRRSSCDVIHWDKGSACKCKRDIGPWTRKAKKGCSQARRHECMESPGCPDKVQRCFDGICTRQSTCRVIHWDKGSACKCKKDIGPWTRKAKQSCASRQRPSRSGGYSLGDFTGSYRGKFSSTSNGRTRSVTTVVTCGAMRERDSKGRYIIKCEGSGTVTLFAYANGRLDANITTSWGHDKSVCRGDVSFDGKRLRSNQTCYYKESKTARVLDVRKL